MTEEQNLWIKVNRKWVTYWEFEERFRDGKMLEGKGKIEILNPLVALKKGRQKIEEMILNKIPASTLLNELERLNKFSDKIYNYYRPENNQVDRAEWPELKKQEAERNWARLRLEEEEKRRIRQEALKDKTTYEPDPEYLEHINSNIDY